MHYLWFLLIVLLLGHLAKPIGSQSTEFIILHDNDQHARFEQTNVNSERCSKEDAERNMCYGGFARLAHEIGKYRRMAKEGGLPVFYLNAGDTYRGTTYFTIFKDKIVSAFLNKLQPDAMSLGNHEFDKRVEGLIPFLNAANFPVLACNLDLTEVPEIKATKRFAHSTILTTKGTRIGVIGYLTPKTKKIVRKNDVEFYEEVGSINAEAKLLRAQGIKIIIALGHSGYGKDQEIALKCPEVDIVVGGHSHTFLYSGDQPDAEPIIGPYPTVITQKSGKKVPVVQAYAFTKYLGRLHVQFDDAGDLITFNGAPILLNAAVPQNQEVLDLLAVYRPNVTLLEESIVGHTKVHLEGRRKVCWSSECNMGNLVADSMVFSRMMEDQGGDFWTDAAISLMNSGGIRRSIQKLSDGAITGFDVLSVLPWGNELFVVNLKGSSIRRALEHAAHLMSNGLGWGFLQMSGIHVVFDVKQPEGHRVVSVKVLCAFCMVPKYSDLEDEKAYNVIVTDYLLEGGDGYKLNDTNYVPEKLERNDMEAMSFYLKRRDYVSLGVEDRIVFLGASGLLGSTALILFSALLVGGFS
ncbi:hypothetical protein KR059_008758 [Drosophila kikkawai]|nr:hypothetical protein KR059_008758 [Drosophila kikkawai]